MEFLASLSNARPRCGIDKGNLEWLEQLFRQTVGNEKEIRRDDFKKIVISKNPFFTERVFQIFDKDNSGSISLQEFIDAMHQFAGQSPDDKIRFLFKVYDIDGDGLIQHRELQHVMRACMEENGMKFSEDQIDDLTMALFEDADADNRGAITYEALKNQLEKHGGLLENLSISIDRWLVPPKPKPPPRSLLGKLSALRPYQLSRPYMKNNYVYLIFLDVFVIINLGLFISRSIEYRAHHGFVIVARACGQCLNFNCMFILVLMLRQCITFLRTHGFSMFLPLDQHIYFHKLTGVFIFGLSVLHTIMHLSNFSLVVVNDPSMGNYTLTEWLLTDRPGKFGLVPGVANPTGIALIIILVIMFICSQPFVRRGGSFEIFYWTHLLYIPFWILVILHGPNFWKWFIGPGILYLIERLVRFVSMRSERGKTYISSGLLLPSRVTHLVIKRPHHFDYHAGDYVFVNVPAIAKYEWHPFTISSAPEQEDYMWLHIRGVGEWTNRMYNYFEREHERLHSVEDQLSGNMINRPMVINGTPEPKGIKRLQASIQRKFTDRDSATSTRSKAVDFMKHADSPRTGYLNESTSSDSDFNLNSSMPHHSDSDISGPHAGNADITSLTGPPRKLTPDKKLHMLLMTRNLREYMRSESEKSFDECQIRRARLQSLGLAYLSPQNKSLAQSFRYMRNKPTIIAFKTPSLENCEASMALLPSGGQSPERSAEEGRSPAIVKVGARSDDVSLELVAAKSPITSMNYPVGKPLEILEDPINEIIRICDSGSELKGDDDVSE
ncbi:hypothetical protein C0J52_23521 [Blattella germanica]|nr:hypothetical protein C0J52_23521 [Blattella germanica]